MSMLGFVYLVLILGWIMIVLFLKCKKTITPHLTLGDNYTDTVGAERRPSVHVIDLPIDDIENVDQHMSAYHEQSDALRRHSRRSSHRSIEDERTIAITYPTDAVITYPTDAVINHAYTNDEEYIINAPPPSYDEVMRQPEIYPKVHQICKSSDAQI